MPHWYFTVLESGRSDPGLAIGVGVLIAFVTGLWSDLVILWFSTSEKKSRSKRLRVAIVECLALPTFWFGGPWVSGQLLSNGNLGESLDYYVLSLAVGLLLIAGYPLICLIVRTGEAIRGYAK
jgi:hypothetical protein